MYNNPYNYYPYTNMNFSGRMPIMNPMGVKPRGGLFKGLSGIKWGTILNNTQKTLNVINQAIPVYYQIKPIFSNVRSFGKLMSIFNESESDTKNTNNLNSLNKNNKVNSTKKENKNTPTFFID